MINTFNLLVALVKQHQVTNLLLALAIAASVLKDVHYRRTMSRVITFTGFFWVIIGSMADLIPTLLWNVIFLLICGLRPGVAILLLPILYLVSVVIKVYSDFLIAKVGRRFIRTITFILGAFALWVEWHVLPTFTTTLPYRNTIDATIAFLPGFVIRAVSVMLFAEVIACCFLLLFPRKFKRGLTSVTEDDHVIVVKLEQFLKILPQSGWIARQLLRFQAFLLGSMDKYFLAGGALLESMVNTILAVIHACHVFVVVRIQRRKRAQ